MAFNPPHENGKGAATTTMEADKKPEPEEAAAVVIERQAGKLLTLLEAELPDMPATQAHALAWAMGVLLANVVFPCGLPAPEPLLATLRHSFNRRFQQKVLETAEPAGNA